MNTSTTEVWIAVDGPNNRVPTAAEAAPDPAVVGLPCRLNGLPSSDADGQPLIHAWEQVEGPRHTLQNRTGPQPSAVFAQPGTYKFKHYVDDGADRSIPTLATVVVRAGAGGGPGNEPNSGRFGCAATAASTGPGPPLPAALIACLFAWLRLSRRPTRRDQPTTVP